MKYIKQKLASGTCGPVAIYNALIWLNRAPCLDSIIQDSRCTKKYGTSIQNVTKCLKQYKVKFSHKRKINNKEIIKELKQGHAIIYLYQTGCNCAHYVLIVGFGKYNQEIMFDVVNERFSISDRYCSSVFPIPAKFYSRCASNSVFLLRKFRKRYPQAWVIKKKIPLKCCKK